MKFRFAIMFLTILATMVFMKINTMSFYVYDLGITNCTNEYSCLHESGHKLDDELGNISRSEAFANAVRLYILVHDDELALKIVMFDGLINYSEQYYSGTERFSSPIQELYAEIYVWHDGNISKIPKEFQKFYTKQ